MADELGTLTPADLIAQMNREFTETKEDPTQKQAIAPVIPPPATLPTEPPVTPPGTTPLPAPKPAVQKDPNYIPQDPSFVQKPTETQPPPTGETTPPADGTQPPVTPAVEAPKVADELFYGRLSELTEGHIKKEEDFVRFVSQFNELVDQQMKGFEPQFPSARAKWAYELLQKNPGAELETAQRTIRAQSLDVAKMEPKDLLFEKFLLDPLNKKVATDFDKARKYFEADYESRFNDLDNSLNQQLILERESEQARDQIAAIQAEREKVDAPAQQQAQQAEQYMAQAAEEFGGIRLPLTANPGDTDYLNIPITDPTELERLKFNALNPDKWHAEFANQFQTPQGYDWAGYLQARYEIENHVAIREKYGEEMFKRGQSAKVQEHRNSTLPTDISKLAPAPPAPKQSAKSFAHAWLDKVESGG